MTARHAGDTGAVAKDGAEGVLVAARPDGRAIALKLADGSWRASRPVVPLRSTGGR